MVKIKEPTLSVSSADQLTESVTRAFQIQLHSSQSHQNPSTSHQSTKSLSKKSRKSAATRKNNKKRKQNVKPESEIQLVKELESTIPVTVEDSTPPTSQSSHETNISPPKTTRYILPRVNVTPADLGSLFKYVSRPVIIIPRVLKDNAPNKNPVSPPESANPIQTKPLQSCNAGNSVQIPSNLFVSDSRKLSDNLSDICNSSAEVCEDVPDRLTRFRRDIHCRDTIINDNIPHLHTGTSNVNLTNNMYAFNTEITQPYEIRDNDSHVVRLPEGQTQNNIEEQFLQENSRDSDYGRLVIAHQSDSISLATDVSNSYENMEFSERSIDNSVCDRLYASSLSQQCYTSHLQQSSQPLENSRYKLHTSVNRSGYDNLSSHSQHVPENSQFSGIGMSNGDDIHQAAMENNQFSDQTMLENSHISNQTAMENNQFSNQSALENTQYSTQNAMENNQYANVHTNETIPSQSLENTQFSRMEISKSHDILDTDTHPEITHCDQSYDVYPTQNSNSQGKYHDYNQHNHSTVLPPLTDTSSLQYENLERPDIIDSVQSSQSQQYELSFSGNDAHYNPLHKTPFHRGPLDLSRIVTTTCDMNSKTSHPIVHTSEFQSIARLLRSPKIASLPGDLSHVWPPSDSTSRLISPFPVLDLMLKTQVRDRPNNTPPNATIPYDHSRTFFSSNNLNQIVSDQPGNASLLSHCQQLMTISTELQTIANRLTASSQIPQYIDQLNGPFHSDSGNQTIQDKEHLSHNNDNNDTDETHYCVECNLSYLTPCTTHNLTYTTIPDSTVLSRARLSLPSDLQLKPSQISTNTTGVWSTVCIPRYTRFGPLIGKHSRPSKSDISDKTSQKNIWKIIYRGQMETLDVTDEESSNWMMFVQPAASDTQQNIVAFQQKQDIYFVTCRLIEPGQELLLWYAADYVLLLGLPSKPDAFKHCPKCKKDLPILTDLKQHMKYNHPDTSRRKWQCYICGITQMTPAKLRIHMMSHSKTKPHECNLCKRSFTDKSNLRRHMTIHSGEKKFECLECGKKFRLNSILQSHMISHSTTKRYQCRYCDKMINRAHDLRKHELEHSTEVSYFCDECGKSFHLYRNFVRHKKIHKGIKNFACGKCDKKFASRYHSKRHETKCKSPKKPVVNKT